MATDSYFKEVLKKSRDFLALDVELSKYVKKFMVVETLEALPYFTAQPKYYGCALIPDRDEEEFAGIGALDKNVRFYFWIVAFTFLMNKEVGLIGKTTQPVRGLMQLAEDLKTPLRLNNLSAYLTDPIFILGTNYQGVDIGDGNLYQACIIECTCMKEIRV